MERERWGEREMERERWRDREVEKEMWVCGVGSANPRAELELRAEDAVPLDPIIPLKERLFIGARGETS